MSKMKSEKSSGNRIFAGILGLILAFSLISGSVAVAENKAAVAEVKKAGFKLSTDELSALEFMANLDAYYFKVQAGEKLPKNIVDLLKKYDGERIYQIIYLLTDNIGAEEHLKVIEHRRSEYNFVFPGVFFLENEKERAFLEEIIALHNEMVKFMDKKIALEISSRIVDYFGYVKNTPSKGEYGFHGLVDVVFNNTVILACEWCWTRKPEYSDAIRLAIEACYFNPRMVATIDKMRSDLGIIEGYELPVKAIYPATREQLDAEAEEKTDQEK